MSAPSRRRIQQAPGRRSSAGEARKAVLVQLVRHPPPRRWKPSSLLCALSLLLVVGAVAAPAPLCDGGLWPEASMEALENGTILPLVQCWRRPACVRHTYLTRKRCQARPLDSDWAPAEDAPDSAAAQLAAQAGEAGSFAALAERFFTNRTVLLTGDSVTEGVWDFLLCQAAREGLRPVRAVAGGHHQSSAVRRVDAALAARLETFLARRNATTWPGLRAGDEPRDVVLLPHSGTVIARKGASAYNYTDMASQLTVADVVVVNYGLHYAFVSDAQKTEYAADMGALMAQVQAAAQQPGRAVLFRETAAQHFAGTGSYESWKQAHPSNITSCACAPMPPEVARTNLVTGYNVAVAAALRAAAARDVRLLPFYALTQDRDFGHEASYCSFVQRNEPHGCCDCTHMCFTPQLARAIVAQMYAALVGTNADTWLAPSPPLLPPPSSPPQPPSPFPPSSPRPGVD